MIKFYTQSLVKLPSINLRKYNKCMLFLIHSQTIDDRILLIGLEPKSEIFLGFSNTLVPI